MNKLTIRCKPMGHRCSCGFIVAYVLFGIALLAVVVGGISAMSNSDNDQRLFASQRDDVINDALTIRSAIIQCAVLFPAGNNGDANTGAPAFPATGSGLVSDLICPGSPATGDTLWATLTRSGSIALTAPPQRIGLTRWQYSNARLSDGTAEVLFFVESSDPGDTRSARVLQSAVHSRRLNPDAGASPGSAYFTTLTVTRADGSTVVRLRSRSLAN